MAYPLPPIDGITREIQAGFVKPLRRPLTGFKLFAGHEFKTGSWTNEELRWFEVGDMTGAVVSMDLPPVQGDSGTMTTKSVGIPLLTKDIVLGGRKAAQMTAAGLDPVIFESQARAMAVEMERALLVGYPALSGGPVTGLLNDAAAGSAGALGAFTSASAVNAGISTLVQTAVVANATGPFTVVVAREDVGVFQQIISGTGLRIGDNLPGALKGVMSGLGAIEAILPSSSLTTGNIALIDTSEGNYHAVSPKDEGNLRFGLGTATVGEVARSSMLTDENPLMMERTFRALNIVVPRIIRPESTITLGTFTK